MTQLDFFLEAMLIILGISLAVCFIRLTRGPDVPNRTVAFDTIAVHAVGILALFAVMIDAPALLDVATVTAVLGFLGTTMLARYLERASNRYSREHPEEDVSLRDLD